MHRPSLAIAAVLVGVPALLVCQGVAGEIIAGTILLGLVVLVWVWSRRAGESTAGEGVWGLISTEQSRGRYSHSGGLTREEQEATLREIERRAEEIDQHGRGR